MIQNAPPDFIVNDLKNVSFTLPRHFAGNIPVNRQGHPNNTLFFWGFEKSNGSLTRSVTDNDSEYVLRFCVFVSTANVDEPAHGVSG